VTLNVGIRFEHDTAYAPDQCHEASAFSTAQCFDEFHLKTFNSLAPRAHLAFDVTGDGKTVVKGGYGRFNQLRELQPDVTSINLNVPTTTTWTWHDNNGNKLYEDGEVNLDPNGPDFRSSPARRWASSARTKQPDRQFPLTFERELFANTAAQGPGSIPTNTAVESVVTVNADSDYESSRPYWLTQGRYGPAVHLRKPTSLGRRVLENDVRQPTRMRVQDLRNRGHEAPAQRSRHVDAHVDRRPDFVRRLAWGTAAVAWFPTNVYVVFNRPITQGSGRPRCRVRITCRSGFWRRPTTISETGCAWLGKCSLQAARPFVRSR
jgi:hypothetical protein